MSQLHGDNALKETAAMTDIVSALQGLDPESVRRVLAWAVDVFVSQPDTKEN